MRIIVGILVIVFVLFMSSQIIDLETSIDSSFDIEQQLSHSGLIDSSGNTIQTRCLLPKDFIRIKVENGSFEEYLRTLPLKPIDTEVKYYNGNIKDNNNVYCSVIDMDIGNKNLHQCADAVMRLRA